MAVLNPETEVQQRYSSVGAEAASWSAGRKQLATAEVYWIATVHPDGHPHVTPIIGIWLDDAFHFSTGPDERKARNLARNGHCTTTTTAGNAMSSGFDVVAEGHFQRVHDPAVLQCLVEAYASKYGWGFAVDGRTFRNERGDEALVVAVAPATAYGYGREGWYTATQWRFG